VDFSLLSSILSTLLRIFIILFILFLILSLLSPFLQRRSTSSRRLRAIRSVEEQRNSRVITLIHRQDSVLLLGMPISRFIDIDDSEALLRAVRLTPDDVPIDLIVHTPGGLVLAADQIAQALVRR
jgi:ClpP class serine protease